MRLKLLLFLVISLQSFIYAQPYRIAIIPFTINAEEELSHIKDGIYELLSSRLSKKDTVIIISRDETEKSLENIEKIHGESLALIVGAKLKANFVIYGSLTFSDQDSSIVMKVVDVSGENPSLAFSKGIKEIDKVIPQINLFATGINKQIFHYKETKKAEDSIQSPQVQVQPIKEEKDSIITGSETAQPLPYDKIFSEDFWGSETFNISIIGIALGDVDSDGTIETIVLTSKMVMMYRCVDNKFSKIKDIKKIKNNYPIGIDIADINGNGIPEIFVTTLDFSRTRATAFVLEFDGEQFNTISKKIRFYLRAVKLSDTTHMLFGQSSSIAGAFSGNTYELKWDNWKYVSSKKILPSRNTNVLGLAYGPIMNKSNAIVTYNTFDYIKIIDTTGQEVWNSEEAYGGNTLYYKLQARGEASTENIDYLPMRLQIDDINKDGSVEVIAVKNHPGKLNFLGKIRYFKKSHIEILTWDGLGLASQWKSGIISNYIRDFAIGDFDNDGKDEFVAALVLRESKSFFVKPKSSIIAFDMKQ